jgi:hypothetical protein
MSAEEQPFGWGRIQEEAQVVERCKQLGGVVLERPSQAGFRAPDQRAFGAGRREDSNLR